jgi:TrmH family RNA methyltransferase
VIPVNKLPRELKKAARRKELGLAVIEGARLVTDALKSGVEFVRLYASKSFISSEIYKEIITPLKAMGFEPVVLSDSLFNAACDTKTPQGILAVIKADLRDLEDILTVGSRKSYVILDGSADPGNAGSIIRSAEAAGFSGMIMSEGCVDLYSPKTLRASMGSAFRLPIVRDVDLAGAIRVLKNRGVTVLAAMPDGDANYYDIDLSGDIALVIGSEAFGVSGDVADICDGKLCIPAPGGAESLNAGVAAGILIFEVLRQRQCGK